RARAAWEQLLAEEEGAAFTPGIPSALNNLGALADRTGDRALALKYFRRALPMMDSPQSGLPRALVLHEIAHIEEEQGHLPEAEQGYAEAVKLLDSVRSSLAGISEAKS